MSVSTLPSECPICGEPVSVVVDRTPEEREDAFVLFPEGAELLAVVGACDCPRTAADCAALLRSALEAEGRRARAYAELSEDR